MNGSPARSGVSKEVKESTHAKNKTKLQLTEFVEAKAETIHQVKVADLGCFEHGKSVVELLAVIRRAHVVVAGTRSEKAAARDTKMRSGTTQNIN